MDEEWTVIDEFPNLGVSDMGRIEDIVKRRLVPTRLNAQGFVMITFRDYEGFQHTRSVAILVAQAFCHTSNDHFTSVIHLNGDRTDCRAMNLMWRSRPFAIQYHKMFSEMPLRLSVRIIETDEFFGSLRELCTTYGLIENKAYNDMTNGIHHFPYTWHIERANE